MQDIISIYFKLFCSLTWSNSLKIICPKGFRVPTSRHDTWSACVSWAQFFWVICRLIATPHQTEAPQGKLEGCKRLCDGTRWSGHKPLLFFLVNISRGQPGSNFWSSKECGDLKWNIHYHYSLFFNMINEAVVPEEVQAPTSPVSNTH